MDTLAFQEHNIQPDMPTSQAMFGGFTIPSPSVELVTSMTLDVNHDTLDMSDNYFLLNSFLRASYNLVGI